MALLSAARISRMESAMFIFLNVCEKMLRMQIYNKAVYFPTWSVLNHGITPFVALTLPMPLSTLVKLCADGCAVEIAAYDHEFHHSVAIFRIPVLAQSRFGQHKLGEFLFGCRGKP